MINKFQQGGQANAQEQLRQIFKIAKAAVQGDQQAIQMMTKVAQQVGGPQGLQQLAQYAQQMGDQEGAQALVAIADSMAQSARQGTKLNYLKKITNKCPQGTQLTYYKVGGQICSKCEAMQQQKPMDVMASIKAEMFQKGGKSQQTTWTKADDTRLNKYKSQGNQLDPKKKKLYSTNTKEEKADSIRLQKKWDNAKNKKDFEVEEGKKGTKISAKACPKCGKVHTGKCGSKLMKKKKKCACGTKIDVKKCGSKLKKDACGSKMKMDKCGSKLKKAKKHQLGGILEAMQKLQNGGSLKSIPFTKTEQ